MPWIMFETHNAPNVRLVRTMRLFGALGGRDAKETETEEEIMRDVQASQDGRR